MSKRTNPIADTNGPKRQCQNISRPENNNSIKNTYGFQDNSFEHTISTPSLNPEAPRFDNSVGPDQTYFDDQGSNSAPYLPAVSVPSWQVNMKDPQYKGEADDPNEASYYHVSIVTKPQISSYDAGGDMWPLGMEGGGSQEDYKNAGVLWNQVYPGHFQESSSSSLVDSSAVRKEPFLETHHGIGMQPNESQLPRQPSVPPPQYGTNHDLQCMPKESPPMALPYMAVSADLGQPNNSTTFSSSGFEVLQHWTEEPRSQKYGGVYAPPKPERQDSKWEFIFDKTSGNISDKKAKGRNRPLSPESRGNASHMRKIRACLRCRLSKVACSDGNECDHCKNRPRCKNGAPLAKSLCVREHLVDFCDLFFPSWLNSYLQKANIEEGIQDNIAAFSDNGIEVHLSSGPTYPKIPLLTYEFRPKNKGFLSLPQLVPCGNDRKTRTIVNSYALPLGLSGPTLKGLRNVCSDHIKSIVEGPRNPEEWKQGDTSKVSWVVFEAIDRYRRATQVPGETSLLDNAAMLYAMHFFLKEKLLFTNETAKKALQSLRSPPQLPYVRDLSPKLITRQVKYEVYILVRQKTVEVLQSLETELMKASKGSWGTCFCVITLLFMCAEMVQVLADLKVVHELRSNTGVTGLSRDTSIEACRNLDARLIWQSMTTFHKIYRSDKQNTNNKMERAFNPLRDGIRIDSKEGIDEPMLDLVKDICGIKLNLDKEIQEHEKEPFFDDKPDLLANHMEFRYVNSGRLVAKFLRSF